MAEEGDNVKVIVRVRPLDPTEVSRNYRNVVDVDAINGTITLKNPDPMTPCPPKEFAFDNVFDRDSKQVHTFLFKKNFEIQFYFFIKFGRNVMSCEVNRSPNRFPPRGEV